MLDVAFVALAIASVAGGIGLLTSRNVVHAAFWLLEVAISAAGLFALLEAHYVAVIQLLIYAGAVAMLNIFTIMITLRRREDAIRPRDFSLPGAVLAVLFFGLVLSRSSRHPFPPESTCRATRMSSPSVRCSSRPRDGCFRSRSPRSC